jgi:hypothetical protein
MAVQQRLSRAVSVGDVRAMDQLLQATLENLEWPRETSVSFDVSGDGSVLFLDVDLPEIEDLPAEEATPAERVLKLNVRKKSETQRRKEYMLHVHAVVFRLLGECFRALPTIRIAVLSAYTQQHIPTTGRREDVYLISVRASRSAWSTIDFAQLERIDLLQALERFELRRSITRTGIFRPIEPFAPPRT